MVEIRAVVYDFGGVLLSYEKVEEKWQEMSKSLGLDAKVMHREAVGTEFSKWLGPDRSLFLGTLCVDELESGIFVDYLKQKYGDLIKDNVQVRPYSVCLREPKFHHNMIRTVEVLRSKGFKTAMLTNNMFLDKAHEETRLPMDLSHFDEVVESCLEHKMKPDPDFYRIVEQRLGLSGPQLVFLDDLEENLEAARKLGWHAIKVGADVGPAIEELTRLTGVQF